VRRTAGHGLAAAAQQFVYQIEPLATSMARARHWLRKPAGSGPVVLLDHSDNCASGGTMDTMTVLGASSTPGSTDVAAFAIFDPAAVQQMIARRRRAARHAVAGRQARHARIGLKGQPRTVTGRVRLMCDGRYRNRGPMGRGESTTWARPPCCRWPASRSW
jgi:microcystin degradation protein MlrC